MLLSIAMMVKNEEKYLDQCLSSLTPLLNSLDSELIIVDTGSDDNTVEIAKKYTNNLFFHNWNNDFSEMRNITLSYCKGDWFFIIDGDEILENTNDIIKFFSSQTYKKYNSATIKVKNLADLKDETNFSIFSSVRFFKRDKDFRFINAVHNQPLYKGPTKNLSSNCRHYGYISTDKELMEKKFNRTVTILENELKKDPKNIYYLFQLSVSYSMHNNYCEALAPIESAYEILKGKKENPKNYIYVYQQLCLCYFNVQDYSNVVKYAEESLKYDENIIDIYYCLGMSLANLKKNEDAIKSLELYLNFYENQDVRNKNVSIVNYTLGRINQVCYMLYVLNRDIKKYRKAKAYLLNITDNCDIPKNMTELCLTAKEYADLKKYEEDLLSNNKINDVNKLYIYIENAKLKLDNDETSKLTEVFSSGNSSYNTLNKIRDKFENDKTLDINEINKLLEMINLPSEPFYFGDLIYYLIYNKSDLDNVTKYLSFEKINEFLQYSTMKYSDFHEVVFNYLLKYVENENFDSIKFNKEICRYLIMLNKLDKEKLENIYDRYLELGVVYVNNVYSEFVIENEYLLVTRTQEEKFFIYINKANSYIKVDKIVYLRYLKMALQVYPAMKNLIAYLLEKDKQNTIDINNEFENYKNQVKNTIKLLIKDSKIAEAKSIINEYESIVRNDVEIIFFKSQIALMESVVECNL